ncbi:hypothetical protein BGX26_011008 [Mortierella sp. AD094]|nr:hypothetical protein BGX26_011008 [Mortierella sp. AD094]
MAQQQLPQSPTSAGDGTWLNASNLVTPQDALNYYSQQNSMLSNTGIHPFDAASGDERLALASSSSSYSASPSPSSYPPSPQLCDIQPTYLGLSTTSSPPSVASISVNGLYPDPLVSNVYENFRLNSQQYSYTPHPFVQDGPLLPLRGQSTQSTRPLFVNGYEGNIDNQGAGNPAVMQTPRSASVSHPHQHFFESRTMTHLHPYSRHHSATATPIIMSYTGSFDSFGMRQVSAPSSPVASSPTATTDTEIWLPVSQHRRSVSEGHAQFDEFNRRYSEGDLNSSDGLTCSNPGSPESEVTPGASSSSGSGAMGVYKCEYEGCTKSFSRPYNLNSHVKTHTNQRPFRCDYCDRQFARLHDKNRHERLHRGVRPFACDRCQHHFARTDALNRHLKVEGGRNLCNMYLIERNSPRAMPIVEMPPKKINPLILAHFPNFGKESPEGDDSQTQS